MIGTAVGPEYILCAGGIYDVPASVGKKMLAAKMVAGSSRKVERDGKEVTETVWGGPAARRVTDPKIAAKAKRLPAQPDPEDKQVMEDTEYLDTDDDDTTE
jgi:hypothetical protein